jgi:hypothetical protein
VGVRRPHPKDEPRLDEAQVRESDSDITILGPCTPTSSSTSTGTFLEGYLPSFLPWKDRPRVGIIGDATFQWAWIAESLGYGVVII